LGRSNNSVVLLIVSIVAVVAIVSMLLLSSDNRSSFDAFGFASSVVYPGYAIPISGISVDKDLNFSSSSDTIQKSLDVSDDIIYRRAYVSYDGQSWTPFNLTPSGSGTISGEWIYGRGSSSVSFSPTKLNLNAARNSSNNTYIIVYSCSKNTTIHNWSCHDGWQIIKFDAKLNSMSFGSNITIYAVGSIFEGVYPTMELIIDNNVVASWIVDGYTSLPTYNAYSYTHTSIIDKDSIVRVNEV
jgi:hypothetical protein